MQNRTYKSLTVFLVTLILLSTFTFLVSASAQDKNLVAEAELFFGVVEKSSATLVFGEKNCSVKPLVFGADKVFIDGKVQQNTVSLTSEKYNVLVHDVENGVEYVLVVKDRLERGFVEFEVDTMGYSVTQDGSLLTELPKKDYVVWNETYAFDGVNETRKDISLVGALRFIPEGAITEEFVIKRPYIYDSKGEGVWGEQKLNGNVLTVTVPKDFLEKAVYPIYVDPTIIFSDGFESGDFSAYTWTSGGASVVSSPKHCGSYAGKYPVQNEASECYSVKGFDAVSEVYGRVYWQCSDLPVAPTCGWATGLAFLVGSNDVILPVFDTDANKWGVFERLDGGWSLLTEDGTSSLSADTWYCVELYVKVHATEGEIKLWIDNSLKLNLTGRTTNSFGDINNLLVGYRYVNEGQASEISNYVDCVQVSDSYIGTESSVPESLSVELGSPSNASTTTSYSQNFTYTPTIIGSDSIQNASLYIDNSLVASNATAITNATANTISYTFTSNGKYEWTIGVSNTTHLVFPYGNFTITVDVNDSLTEVEKSDYTTIILFVISIILCIIGLALTVPLLPLISLTISVLNIIFLSEPSIFNILLTLLNVTFTVIALVRAKTKNN